MPATAYPDILNFAAVIELASDGAPPSAQPASEPASESITPGIPDEFGGDYSVADIHMTCGTRKWSMAGAFHNGLEIHHFSGPYSHFIRLGLLNDLQDVFVIVTHLNTYVVCTCPPVLLPRHSCSELCPAGSHPASCG